MKCTKTSKENFCKEAGLKGLSCPLSGLLHSTNPAKSNVAEIEAPGCNGTWDHETLKLQHLKKLLDTSRMKALITRLALFRTA